MAGGGTSIEEPKPRGGILAFVIVAPIVAYAVHRIGAPRCSWDYGGSGGACRSVILLSVLAGAVAGGLAGAAAKRATSERAWLGFALGAAAVLVLGIMAAGQFDDYMNAMAGTKMTDDVCTFARKTLPDCVEQVWGPHDAETVRQAQPDCYGDARSVRNYQKCMVLTDCRQIIDCIANR